MYERIDNLEESLDARLEQYTQQVNKCFAYYDTGELDETLTNILGDLSDCVRDLFDGFKGEIIRYLEKDADSKQSE